MHRAPLQPAACGNVTLPLPAFPSGGVRTQHSGERAFREAITHRVCRGARCALGLLGGVQRGRGPDGVTHGDVELAECLTVGVREPELVAEPVGVDPGRGDAADPRGRRGLREVLLQPSGSGLDQRCSRTLADLAASECGTCANFLSTAQQFENSATHADGPSFEVDNVKVTPGAPEGRIFLSSTIRQLPSRVVDGSGQVLSQATPDEIAADIALTWTGASWRTYAVSF